MAHYYSWQALASDNFFWEDVEETKDSLTRFQHSAIPSIPCPTSTTDSRLLLSFFIPTIAVSQEASICLSKTNFSWWALDINQYLLISVLVVELLQCTPPPPSHRGLFVPRKSETVPLPSVSVLLSTTKKGEEYFPCVQVISSSSSDEALLIFFHYYYYHY